MDVVVMVMHGGSWQFRRVKHIFDENIQFTSSFLCTKRHLQFFSCPLIYIH